MDICPRFQKAADLLGKRWTGLVLRQLQAGPLRFGQLAEQVGDASARMLAARLRELEASGVVSRSVLPDRGVEYALTPKGRALGRVVSSLGRWAEEWIDLPQPGRQEPRPSTAGRARAAAK